MNLYRIPTSRELRAVVRLDWLPPVLVVVHQGKAIAATSLRGTRRPRLRRPTRAAYPIDWPRCRCGDYALDGHLTCGRVLCEEGAARDAARRRLQL